ncbi:MAG: cupin domain-containing protein [Calditrichaeota bacterium]|nr:MAG: cupin domain-containing protein [Calditrichota bacterium]MBL1208108.1 cupin domain-containing protein [Calditrichota bacterium]NOG47946.1 cupin domain-containing protein [Calditrichota bacterium]
MTHIKKSQVPVETVGPGLTRQIMGHDSDLMLVKVNFEKGAIGEPHKHPHHQVSYVIEGKFDVTIDGVTKTLEAGDAFVVPTEVMHGAICTEKGILIDTFSPAREDFLE